MCVCVCVCVCGYIEMSKLSSQKSQLLYEAIESSSGYYDMVVQKGVRSRVNIPFRINSNNKPNPEEEKRFIEEAKKANLIHINGHRSVGGLRASLYNAISVKDTNVLIEFMVQFMDKSKS